MPEPLYDRTLRYCPRCRATTDHVRARPEWSAGLLALAGLLMERWHCELCLERGLFADDDEA